MVVVVMVAVVVVAMVVVEDDVVKLRRQLREKISQEPGKVVVDG